MEPKSVPYAVFARFMNQHLHDVANGVNGIGLEAALLAELVKDSEAAASIIRLRRNINVLAAELKALRAKLETETGFRSLIVNQGDARL